MKTFDIQYWLGLGWLTGPIFGKELRVSSRRRRHYTIRALYIGVLAVIMFFIWMQMGRYGRTSAYQSGELSQMGRVITMLVTWSQFILCQIVAGVMLSTAISDEVYNKTLGVLMTTPISGLQIVTGKLLSKLLQCILLVGVSLPALAMVRVFGGIPWTYVLSSVCITLCMSVWVGSLSLFFSISQRKAYVVIIQTLLTLGVVFALIPMFLFWFLEQVIDIPERKVIPYFLLSNPYIMMAMATDWLMSPRGLVFGMMRYWPWHCLILLAGSSGLLFWCTLRVRKVALRQIAGDTGVVKKAKGKARAKSVRPVRRSWLMRHMGNWPVLWKDLRTPVLAGKTRLRRVLSRCLLFGILGLMYTIIGIEGGLGENEFHTVLCCIYMILACLLTMIITATCITSEKEARSWPILLGTAQSDWQILVSKAMAMFRWSLPVWGLLFGHLTVFCLTGGVIHPAVLMLLVPMTLGVMSLMVGTGLYWSARLRKTTTAVVCNFIVPLTLWLIIPILWVIILETTRGMSDNGLETYISCNPVVQIVAAVDGCARNRGTLRFSLPGGRKTFVDMLALVWVSCIVHGSVGYGFAWRAKQLFRQRVF